MAILVSADTRRVWLVVQKEEVATELLGDGKRGVIQCPGRMRMEWGVWFLKVSWTMGWGIVIVEKTANFFVVERDWAH